MDEFSWSADERTIGADRERLAGQRLGRYHLLQELGRGAMGAVYRARDEEAERDVALKLLLPSAGGNQLDRLKREGILTAALRHPGIVGIHDAGELAGRAYLAYELVEGARTLGEVLPLVEREERVRLVRDVAEAVGHAHAQGVLHRDLKPSNVLVDPQRRARVADFGLARASDSTRLTETNAVVGTPLYMSPEQVGGVHEQVGPPSDVWSLGVILYQALTGEVPFLGQSMVELALAITANDPRAPRALDPTIPRGLEGIVQRAMASDPARRYPEGAALAADLDRYLRGEALEPFGEQRLLRVVGIMAAGALVVAGLALGYASQARQAPAAPSPPGPLALQRALAEDEASFARLVERLEGLDAPAAWAWRARAALERGEQLSAGDALQRARDAGLERVPSALLEARLAQLRGGDALSVLRAARGGGPGAPLPRASGAALGALQVAEAELLLIAGHPDLAQDTLPARPERTRAPAFARCWGAPQALGACLRGLLQDPPEVGPLLGADEAWRAGAVRWLRREARSWVVWLELQVDPRRGQPRAPVDSEAIERRARGCLRALAALGEADAARRAQACLDPPAHRALPAELAPARARLGTLEGWVLLALAEGALARDQGEAALALLGRLEETPGREPDVHDLAGAQRERAGWLRGRALLALRRPAEALAALDAAAELRALSHAGIQRDRLAAARAAAPARVEALQARLALLEGLKRAEGAALLQELRRTRRESGPTERDVQRVLELDPASPLARYYLGRARFSDGWGWQGLRRCLAAAAAYPTAFDDLFRVLRRVNAPGPEQPFVRRGLFRETIRAVPQGALEARAFLAALMLDATGGEGAEARAALALLDRALERAPAAWELRVQRGLVRARLGYAAAARRDLDWAEAAWPQVGQAWFYRALALARGERPVEEVLEALRAARNFGYKAWRESNWEPSDYPELTRLRGEPGVAEFLDLARR